MQIYSEALGDGLDLGTRQMQAFQGQEVLSRDSEQIL